MTRFTADHKRSYPHVVSSASAQKIPIADRFLDLKITAQNHTHRSLQTSLNCLSSPLKKKKEKLAQIMYIPAAQMVIATGHFLTQMERIKFPSSFAVSQNKAAEYSRIGIRKYPATNKVRFTISGIHSTILQCPKNQENTTRKKKKLNPSKIIRNNRDDQFSRQELFKLP